MTLKHLTGSTADTYLEYVQRNLPEGVSMKVKISVMSDVSWIVYRTLLLFRLLSMK